jgi:hypothetical protein
MTAIPVLGLEEYLVELEGLGIVGAAHAVHVRVFTVQRLDERGLGNRAAT